MFRFLFFVSLFSLPVFASDSALEIQVLGQRPDENLQNVNYVVQAIIGRLVSEVVIGKYNVNHPSGEGMLGNTYCVEVTAAAIAGNLDRLESIFSSFVLPDHSTVRYRTKRVSKCGAAD